MLLGQVLQEVRSDPDPLDRLAEDINLVNLARAGAVAEAAGCGLSEILRAAVDGFLNNADEEDWMQLIGRLQNGDASPGVCLNLMLRRHLREITGDGCGC